MLENKLGDTDILIIISKVQKHCTIEQDASAQQGPQAEAVLLGRWEALSGWWRIIALLTPAPAHLGHLGRRTGQQHSLAPSAGDSINGRQTFHHRAAWEASLVLTLKNLPAT